MIVAMTSAAREEFSGLQRYVRTRVLDVFDRLEKWPAVSGAKPLRGKLAGKFRMRTGDYRIQFHIAGEKIVVERIAHRDGFYDDQ